MSPAPHVPLEIFELIFLFVVTPDNDLGYRDLCRAERVCREWRHRIQSISNSVWPRAIAHSRLVYGPFCRIKEHRTTLQLGTPPLFSFVRLPRIFAERASNWDYDTRLQTVGNAWKYMARMQTALERYGPMLRVEQFSSHQVFTAHTAPAAARMPPNWVRHEDHGHIGTLMDGLSDEQDARQRLRRLPRHLYHQLLDVHSQSVAQVAYARARFAAEAKAAYEMLYASCCDCADDRRHARLSIKWSG